jgi:hypothetical protein
MDPMNVDILALRLLLGDAGPGAVVHVPAEAFRELLSHCEDFSEDKWEEAWDLGYEAGREAARDEFDVDND